MEFLRNNTIACRQSTTSSTRSGTSRTSYGRSYDLYDAQADASREQRTQVLLGTIAACEIICIGPLMVLRWAVYNICYCRSRNIVFGWISYAKQYLYFKRMKCTNKFSTIGVFLARIHKLCAYAMFQFIVHLHGICCIFDVFDRFVRQQMDETYENSSHFDFTYLMFVWIAFLPTIISPVMYSLWIMSG